jgi:hypothetical protein
MAVDTVAGLKAKMPANTPGGTRVEAFHDIVDTLEFLTSQAVSLKVGNYTASVNDNRSKILFDSPTDVTMTLPSSLPKGWECMVSQLGTGNVIFNVPGGTLGSRDGHGKTAARYSTAALYVIDNPGTSPLVILTGDTAVNSAVNFSSAFSLGFIQ